MKSFPFAVFVFFTVICQSYTLGNDEEVSPGRVKRQSLIPFPRVGRSRQGTLALSRFPMDSRAFWDLQLEGLREGKRQGLIPFPRVGKRQSLIPFPRVGRDPGQGFSDYENLADRGLSKDLDVALKSADPLDDSYGEASLVPMASNQKASKYF